MTALYAASGPSLPALVVAEHLDDLLVPVLGGRLSWERLQVWRDRAQVAVFEDRLERMGPSLLSSMTHEEQAAVERGQVHSSLSFVPWDAPVPLLLLGEPGVLHPSCGSQPVVVIDCASPRMVIDGMLRVHQATNAVGVEEVVDLTTGKARLVRDCRCASHPRARPHLNEVEGIVEHDPGAR